MTHDPNSTGELGPSSEPEGLHLRIIEPPMPVRYFAIQAGCKYFVGRGPGNDINLSTKDVSRNHAVIAVSPEEEVTIIHWQSTHGVVLEGRPLEKLTEHVLRLREEVKLGSVEIELRPGRSGPSAVLDLQEDKKTRKWFEQWKGHAPKEAIVALIRELKRLGRYKAVTGRAVLEVLLSVTEVSQRQWVNFLKSYLIDPKILEPGQPSSSPTLTLDPENAPSAEQLQRLMATLDCSRESAQRLVAIWVHAGGKLRRETDSVPPEEPID